MMDSAVWQAINAAFEEIAGLPLAQRKSALEKLAPEIRSEVESLLVNMTSAGLAMAELEQTIQGSFHLQDLQPEQIGAYAITGLIGSGGMGTVWRAMRSDGTFQQEVAIKVLRNGLDPLLHERFLSERQILAHLKHPNIARLLDGGTTGQGIPWLAMELVEGQPITVYADSAQLDLKARIRLFTEVCAAVQHAHQNLIVHRDLKPSNILVTASGEVKLLDFGIAKLVDPMADGILTQTNWYTPEYASPEQIRQETITTASDVFQLGLVLYELICGQKPFGTAAEFGHTLSQRVLTIQPVAPAKQLAPKTRWERRAFWQPFRQDLDQICLMALRKEPERRYASVEALMNDLRALQAGLPVRAQSDSWAYRLRKFVGRHRIPVGLSGLVVLLLLVGGGFLLLQQRTIRWERDRAQSEAERAKLVASFMEDMYALGETEASRGGLIQVDKLLEESEKRLRQIAGRNGAIEAQLLDVIANSHTRLGHHRKALALKFRSLALKKQTLGWYHLETAYTLEAVVSSYMYLNVPDSSLLYMKYSLGIQERLVPQTDTRLIEGYMHIGSVYEALKQPKTAIAFYEKADALYRAVPNPPPKDVADLYNSWAYANIVMRQYAAAEPILKKAMQATYRYREGFHDFTPMIWGSYGLLYLGQHRFLDAAQAYGQALRLRIQLVGTDAPRVQSTRRYLAHFLIAAGQFSAADTTLQALWNQQQNVGTPALSLAQTAFYRAWVQYKMGNRVQGNLFFRNMIQYLNTAPPSTPQSKAQWSGMTAYLNGLSGDAAAETTLMQSVETLKQLADPDHQIPILETFMADLLIQRKAYPQAEAVLLRANDRFQNIEGMLLRFQGQTWAKLAELYTLWGKPELAKKWRVN